MSWSITKRLLKTLKQEHLKLYQKSKHCGTCLLIEEAEGFCAEEDRRAAIIDEGEARRAQGFYQSQLRGRR